MGKSKELATGAAYVDATGDTMTGNLTVEGATLGSTFANAAYGNGVRVEQTSYTADNYVSLIEAPYIADYSAAGAHVRIGAKFNGSGSSLAMGTSNAYGSGITNTALEIDNAGRVTMPYQPSFLAYDATGGTVSQTGIIPCDTTSYNVGNHYNTSTYKFTAPVAGMYQFGWNHYTNNWNENTRRTFLVVNGIDVMQTGNYGNGIPISMTLKLEVNDQVYLQGKSNFPTKYYAAYAHNAFTGILLG